MARDNVIISAAGSVMAALFWPALRFAAAVRRENLSLRMLEFPLSQAKSAAQAAEAIRDVFLSNFRKE